MARDELNQELDGLTAAMQYVSSAYNATPHLRTELDALYNAMLDKWDEIMQKLNTTDARDYNA